jgi:hypothetical protein
MRSIRERIIEDILEENEEILAKVSWKEVRYALMTLVFDVIIYATNKRLLYVMHEVKRIVYELQYSRITQIELVEKRKMLVFKQSYYQIDGDLNDRERKLWRIPANVENAEEFCRVVSEIVKKRRWKLD